MRADGVIVCHIVVNSCDHLLGRDVFFDINVVVFEAAEEPFGTNVIESPTLAIHGDLNLAGIQQIQIRLIREVAALIGVNDLRSPVTQRPPHATQDKFFLQAVADLIVDYLPTVPVNDHEQVEKAFPQRQVRDIHSPDLIHVVDYKISKQIGSDIFCVVALAEVGPGKQGNDIHEPHQASDAFSVDVIAIAVSQVVGHFAITPGRMFQMGLVENFHDSKVLQRLTVAGISLLLTPLAVDAAAVDCGQLALSFDRKLTIFEGNESDAVRRGQRFRQIFF